MILKEAIRAAETERNEFILAHLAEGLANIYYMKGDYIKSLEWYRRSETGSPDPVLTGYIRRNNKALIYLEWGESDRALEYARQDVAFKERLGLIEALPLAYLQLGLVHLERLELVLAGDYIQRSISSAENNRGEQIFLVLARSILVRYLVIQNKLTEARLVFNQVLDLELKTRHYKLYALPTSFKEGTESLRGTRLYQLIQRCPNPHSIFLPPSGETNCRALWAKIRVLIVYLP